MSRRDPEARRRAIIEAAGRLIAEVGVGGVTHRRVAAEAGVPLGATTYYFKDLDDLIEATIARTAADCAEWLDAWQRDLDAGADVAASLAEATAEYLADPVRHRTHNEMYAAAAHRPELRPAARAWTDGLVRVLAPRVGDRAAQAASAFIDGVLLQALINDRPLDTGILTEALTALLTALREPPDGTPS
ncbi:TetR/AcrR family transcriptional regulator [Actinomadura viridis]|uniref:TetR/AcrR family transcriptional regulator n=1 Tax=Actinomadura viridis TaxID=58110 RepID=UPI00369E2BAD